MQFQPFPKIPRLFRDIVITEKLDGTNASILILEEPLSDGSPYGFDGNVEAFKKNRTWTDGSRHVFCGSRNRWITPAQDNYGFAAWVANNIEKLLNLGHGHHFGEWWGQGIQRNYGLKEKRFSLFNTHRWGRHGEEGQQAFFEKFGCYVVPVLHEGGFSFQERTIEDVLLYLKITGSLAAPGFMNPEGIIVYHKAGDHLYKVLLENDDKPKGLVKEQQA